MHADNVRQFPDRRTGPRYESGRRCALRIDGAEHPGTLRNVSAAGAFVETARPVAVGDILTLLHPEAGQIAAHVTRVAADGAALAFTVGEHAVTFALAAICADMTVRNDGLDAEI